MLNHINNNRSEHIITIEDPIEYLHTHKNSIINQREVGQDSNNYPNALRAALRQDPDIILIGEMRDLETISIAITAAETGHLVFATLHTVNAVSSIERIIDVFPPFQQEQVKVQLANVLEGVISQQLLSRANQRGRIAACEIMIPNSAIRNNIRDGKTHQILSFLQTGRSEGMISMDASLMELYKSNFITKEDALKYAMDRKRMRTLI
jgi:twitching motility protein PilT